MSRTHRKVPFYTINGRRVSEFVHTPVGTTVISRRAKRASKGYEGGASFFNMVDGGGGKMHQNKKWFTKRQTNKAIRQAARAEFERITASYAVDPNDPNDPIWDMAGYPWDVDPFYDDEWTVFKTHFGNGYTGGRDPFFEQERREHQEYLDEMDQRYFDDYFDRNMGILEDYSGPDNPNYNPGIDYRMTDDEIDSVTVAVNDDVIGAGGSIRSHRVSKKQARRDARSEITEALKELAA